MDYKIAFYACIIYILLSVIYVIWNTYKINKLSKVIEETNKLLTTMSTHISANSEMIETLGVYTDTYSEAIVKIADNQERIVGVIHMLVEKLQTNPKSESVDTSQIPDNKTKTKGRRK